jgi:hypothetical protein
MREIRLAIQRPLSAGEARSLAAKVGRFLDEVRAAAGYAGLTPRSLPRPSRLAFEYLASIDLESVAARSGGEDASGPAIRIGRVVAAKDRFLRKLRALTQGPIPRSGRGARAITPLDDLRQDFAEVVAEVAILCERAGVAPSVLPDPSRRAYQWMTFMAEDRNLEAHLRAQVEAARIDPRVRVDLYHLNALYRFAWKHDGVEFTLSEAFVDAPLAVLCAAIKMALPYTRKRQHRRTVAAFAAGDAFERRLLELETAGGTFVEHTRGAAHDLEAAFRRVNIVMFRGRLTRPRLSWLATTSLREFGHYVPATDLVLVSSQLDAAAIPEFVIDHVMHHELLHRELGSRVSGGRRVFHTAAFRTRERQFPRFAEADAFLERMARRG